MNPNSFSLTLDGCEAMQYQLSELADSGAPLSPELQTHIDMCPECARFAEQWLHGAPAALSQPLPALAADTHLRERILGASAPPPPNIVPFPGSGVMTRPWVAWLGRIAACAALAAFSYALLNPVRTSNPPRQSTTASEPTLVQDLTQMEDKSKTEQETLQKAMIQGGTRMRGIMHWTTSALE